MRTVMADGLSHHGQAGWPAWHQADCGGIFWDLLERVKNPEWNFFASPEIRRIAEDIQ